MLPKLTGKFNGTVRYASANCLKGKECSRRDDLISIGYMLIYLRHYELPWKDTLHNIKRSELFDMLSAKQSAKSKMLCKNFPKEFNEYMKYVYSLRFEQDPNYDYLRSLFKQLLDILTNSPKNDSLIKFSWLTKEEVNNSKSPKPNTKRNKSPQFRLLQKIQLNLEKKKTISDILTIDNTKVTSKSVEKITGNTNESKISFQISSNEDAKVFPRKFKNCIVSKADEVELVNNSKSFMNFLVSPEKGKKTQIDSSRFVCKSNYVNQNKSQNLLINKNNKVIQSYKRINPFNNYSLKSIENKRLRNNLNKRNFINNSMQIKKLMNRSNQNNNLNDRHIKNNLTLTNISQNPNSKFMNKTICKTYKSLIPHSENFVKKKIIRKFPQNQKIYKNNGNNNIHSIKNHLISPEFKWKKYNKYSQLLSNYNSMRNFKLINPITNISINNNCSENNIKISKISGSKNKNLNNNFNNISSINNIQFERGSYEKNRNNWSLPKDELKNDNIDLSTSYQRKFRTRFKSDILDEENRINKENGKRNNWIFGSSIISTFNNQKSGNYLRNLGEKYVHFQTKDPIHQNLNKNISFISKL